MMLSPSDLKNVDGLVAECALLSIGDRNAVRRLIRYLGGEGDPNEPVAYCDLDEAVKAIEALNSRTITKEERRELVQVAMKTLRSVPTDSFYEAWPLVPALRLVAQLRPGEALQDVERIASTKVLPPWDIAGPQVAIVEAALDALGVFGADSSAKVIGPRLAEECGWWAWPIRHKAIQALCRIKGREATEFLLGALDHEDFLVAAYAARELGPKQANANGRDGRTDARCRGA